MMPSILDADRCSFAGGSRQQELGEAGVAARRRWFKEVQGRAGGAAAVDSWLREREVEEKNRERQIVRIDAPTDRRKPINGTGQSEGIKSMKKIARYRNIAPA